MFWAFLLVPANALTMTAELNPITEKYSVLGQDDIDRYLKVYALQEKERWLEADKIINRIENKI